MEHTSPFRMEAAGSLTPALDGAPRSSPHRHRTKEKRRGTADEARQEAPDTLSVEQEQTR